MGDSSILGVDLGTKIRSIAYYLVLAFDRLLQRKVYVEILSFQRVLVVGGSILPQSLPSCSFFLSSSPLHPWEFIDFIAPGSISSFEKTHKSIQYLLNLSNSTHPLAIEIPFCLHRPSSIPLTITTANGSCYHYHLSTLPKMVKIENYQGGKASFLYYSRKPIPRIESSKIKSQQRILN